MRPFKYYVTLKGRQKSWFFTYERIFELKNVPATHTQGLGQRQR